MQNLFEIKLVSRYLVWNICKKILVNLDNKIIAIKVGNYNKIIYILLYICKYLQLYKNSSLLIKICSYIFVDCF